jgi:hypothetical protein
MRYEESARTGLVACWFRLRRINFPPASDEAVSFRVIDRSFGRYIGLPNRTDRFGAKGPARETEPIVGWWSRQAGQRCGNRSPIRSRNE